MDIKQAVDLKQVPRHIAIIMDGNGRWAKQQGKARVFGHQNAITAVKSTVEGAAEIGVEYLTLYAFSTENWKRPKTEVTALMELLINAIHNEVDSLNKNNIRLLAIGDIDSLPEKCSAELNSAIKKTAGNKKLNLVLALSYSSRWEITNATKKITDAVLSGKLNPSEIDEELLNSNLATAGFPDPELMIRTSGEHRISNFLLWQMAYAELYFLNKFWPDFRKEDLFKAITEYQKRERRFGLTSDQLKALNE